MKNIKRVLALLAVALLVTMYVLTLVFALRRDPDAKGLFFASVAATIIVPVMLYAMIFVAKLVRPDKSPVVDAIIYPASLFDAASNTSSEFVANAVEKVEDFIDGYRNKGYKVYALTEKEMEKEALSEFAHAHGLEDSKTLVIGSSEQMVLGAKERGFAAFLYENPAHTVRTLISLGVK